MNKTNKADLFTRICLYFIKIKTKNSGTTLIKYKEFRGKIYIIGEIYTGGYRCRHKIIPIE